MPKADDEIIWQVLYRIAAEFPDASKLSQERLRGYYNFFDSLKYTLPSLDLRKYWITATASGNAELSWPRFSRVRSHKELLRWLFPVHDEILRFQGSTKPSITFANRYAHLMGKKREKGNNLDMKLSLGRLKARIKSRVKSMDEFLMTKFPEYGDMSHKRKLKLREQYLDDATRYYWKMLSSSLNSTNTNFAQRPLDIRTAMIVEAFDERFMLRHERYANKLKRFPSVVAERIIQ